MKRIIITGLALLGLMKAYSQAEKDQDSTAYKAKKIKNRRNRPYFQLLQPEREQCCCNRWYRVGKVNRYIKYY